MTDKTVTQADRDRFAEYLEAHGRPATATEMRAGRMDDDDGLLMLARHRLAQTDAQMAAPDGLAAELAALVPGKPLGGDGEFHYFVPAGLMARILASLSASNVMRDALTKARRELYLLSLNEGARDHEIGVLITQIDAALAGQGTTLDRQTVEQAVLAEREADGWERGMIEAATICGSLAETTYDDADSFEAATGCEAAIRANLHVHQRSRASMDPNHVR